MKPNEKLIYYVAQQIQDVEGSPTPTRILKIIYLVDVEYFRRRRKTLTGWDWILYKYGPYAFEYPHILESLGFSDLADIDEGTVSGRRYSLVRTSDHLTVDDITPPDDSFAFIMNRVIKQWALEPIEHLLDYVYFETEPMRDAKKGDRLDFGKIEGRVYEPMVDWDSLIPSKELKARVREKLAELRAKKREARAVRDALTADHPFVRDDDYEQAMALTSRDNDSHLPDDATVETSS